MYKKAESGNFDIVVCDLNYVYEDGSIKRVSSKIEHDTTNIKNVYINMYPCVWNKIYKKTLFENDIEFKKGVWFEDGSTFTIGSYEDIENALIKLRDFYDTPQEIFDSMSRWELYQCLKALCGEGLSHEDIQVFDYILHIYTEKVREENI